jgi:Domain of unknown function (DUF4173)
MSDDDLVDHGESAESGGSCQISSEDETIETRLGLAIIGCALLLGIVGDFLAATPFGINLVLFASAFVAAAAALLVWRSRKRDEIAYAALGLVVVFAAFLTWRDSKLLATLNIAAIVLLLGLATVRLSYVRAYALGMVEYLVALGKSLTAALVGAIELVVDKMNWREVERHARSRQVVSVGRALAIAVPLLVIFTVLFAHADAAFSNLAGGLVPDDLVGLLVDIVIVAGIAFVSIGLLQVLVSGHPGEATGEPGKERLNRLELAIVLGLLDLLFLAFVLIQIRYLFGGKHLIMVRAHLTYAQYAHRGFFELVAVCALALPLLLVADWLRGGSKHHRDPLFSIPAGVLIALLGVIIASAIQRMRIYQQAYGLTELRFYGTAFLIWLAVVFALLLITILNGRRHLFAAAALASALIAVVCLNAVNPDNWIARVNIERFHQGKKIDVAYLNTLSDDAYATLDAAHLAGLRLDQRKSSDCSPDWRTWNWGRAQARNLYCNRSAGMRP